MRCNLVGHPACATAFSAPPPLAAGGRTVQPVHPLPFAPAAFSRAPVAAVG